MKAFLHTDTPLNKRVMEVLKHAKEAAGVTQEIHFAELPDGLTPPVGFPVLSLGSYARRGLERPVVTYSVPQIMAKADTITRLSTAFKLLVQKPDLPAFEYEVLNSETLVPTLERYWNTLLATDIETKGNVDRQIPRWEEMISVAFYDGIKAYVIPEFLLNVCRGSIEKFLRENVHILHNGKFDGKYLGIYPTHDTMLMHYALYPAASSHGLKELSLEYFGANDWDSGNKAHTRGKTYTEWTELGDGAYAQAMKYPAGGGYERIPRTMLYKYNGYDVYWTWHLFKELERVLQTSTDSQKLYDHLMALSHMFQRVETPGVRFDVEYMEQLARELTEKGGELEAELHELAGRPLNPRSPKQVKEYFTEQGYRLASTDANTMNELSAQGNEVAGKISELRDNSKKNGTYVSGYLAKLIDGRGYPGFKLHAASTGRIGGAGPSLLTIPRDKSIKRMVLPDEGQIIVAADLSQAELRCMAVESNDPWMIAAFQPGAGDFFDKLMQATYPELDPVAFKKVDPQGYTNLRAKIKGVVYGVSFGRGTAAIAMALGITFSEAQTLVDGFVRPGSPFAQWRKMIEQRAVKGDPIVNKFGRHFQSELVTSRNKQNVINSALSFTSQSTANDICLAAALAVEPQLAQYSARLISTLHDALYVSAPEKHADTIGELVTTELEKAGEAVYGGVVAFKSDATRGRNMAEA